MYNSEIHIPTFDFEDDRFGKVSLPPSLGKERYSRVGELSGCLFTTESTGEGVNIWVMKEYGVQDSWTKMYSVPCILMGERMNLHDILLVTCMDNGEIFLVGRDVVTRLFSYNPGQECFRLIGYGRGGFLEVISYRPSLVPLKDSMLGYEVHVSALKHRERSTSPDWWILDINVEKRNEHVGATSESPPLEPSVAMPRLQHGYEGGESHGHVGGDGSIHISAPFKEQIEQLKKHNRQLEQRLQDEKAKVKQMKAKIQQSEQLEQQNQQLKERLQNEQAEVKQLKEKLQQSEQLKEESKQMTIQMMDEMKARFMGSH